MIINVGTQERIISEITTGAGSTSQEGSLRSDSLLATLWVDSVTSGSLSVSVHTLTDNGKEVQLFAFPLLVSGTTNILLKKSGVSMQRFKVTATYTGIVQYEVYVRAISGAGESSTKIVSPANLSTSSVSVSTSPTVLVTAGLTDRNGMTIINTHATATLYITEDASKLTNNAYPVYAGQSLALDVAAGGTIYSQSSSGSIDVRIAEVGG